MVPRALPFLLLGDGIGDGACCSCVAIGNRACSYYVGMLLHTDTVAAGAEVFDAAAY